jgi:hypothetical protein
VSEGIAVETKLALHVVRTAFASAAKLEQLLPLLKEHCGKEEGESYGMAIASAIAHIHRELTNKIFSSHPEVEAEIEKRMSRYGQVL